MNIKTALLSLLMLSIPAMANAQSTKTNKLNSAGWPDSLWVAPNGGMALFMYSRYNFFPTILKQKKPLLSGPSRAGHHNNDTNPWDDSDLYLVFRKPDGSWGAPINMPTNDKQADCCAMISGNEMFFQKGTDIYTSLYLDKKWRKAVKLPINSKSVDTNPHFDWRTKTLYWSSNRGGNFDIWRSVRINNSWSNPEPVPGAVNTKHKEDQPFVKGNVMRFSRDGASGNMISIRKNGRWSKAKAEPLGTNLYHSEISVSEDDKTAWFVAADIKTQRLYFMESKRLPNGKWGKAKRID